MAEIRSTVILLLTHYFLVNVGSDAQILSNFTCHNGAEINFVEVCDGESNCADGSDETECNNDAILFYDIYVRVVPVLSSSCQQYQAGYSNDHYFNYYGCNTPDYYGFRNLNITGIYLNEDKQFSIPVVNERVKGHYRISWEDELPKFTNIQISSNGPRLDISYTSRSSNSDVDFLKRVTRAGSVENVQNIEHTHSITSLAVDWVTYNVYYISNSMIKVCDQNFVICVVALSGNKFLRDPAHLTISPKHRLLFWIERLSPQQHYLYKYSIEMNSKTTRISQNFLKAPEWLTVDPMGEKVYWLESGGIYSVTFGGTDLEAISGTSESITSFAVFDNTLYYRSNNYPPMQIWKCSVDECNQPTLFKDETYLFATINHTSKPVYEFGIDFLTIDHRSSPLNKIRNECIRSSCSHLCLLDSETFFKCYCEGSDKPLPTNMNNGFCENATVIAAHENHLYVVGLFSNKNFTPIINTTTVKINRISTVTYDSLKGNVILTEAKRQKIYSWVPRTGELILLLDDGLGSIKSIEFDNYANNLYWIDPANFSIKVMNLDTRMKVIILEGNITYLPIELTLAPAKGYMFVQFLKNNSTSVLERVSMDGRRIRPAIHVDKEIEDVGNLHLHYMRGTDTPYLLDRQKNKIGYFLNEKSGFQDLMYSDTVGEVQSITSMNNLIIWSEDDFIIRRGIVVERNRIVITQSISLKGLAGNGTGTLKLAPVVKSLAVQLRLAKCLRNNGGCQELCLVTEKSPKFVCVCTGNRTLVNGNICKNASEIVSESTTHENNTPHTDLAEGNTSMKQTENVTSLKEQKFQTESTCIKSCPILQCPILQCPSCERITTNDESPPSKRNFTINVQKNETANYVESCSVCQTSICSSSVERSLSYDTLFNSIFIAVLAIPLGFTLGYLFHIYRSFSQYSHSKFLQENGSVELSQMQAESTTTLCSRISESVNNARKN